MERTELTAFLRGLGCAEFRGGYAFLCDPHLSQGEQATQAELWAKAETLPPSEQGWLCVRTGGSGGGVKFARHDERTLGAAVQGFQSHFGLDRISAVGVLPPWHVSGLMARLRSFATGGDYVAWGWKALEAGELPALTTDQEWVLSLVPTQLQRLLVLPAAVAWLQRLKLILIGGGPMWPELAEAAAHARLPLSLGYGMTETGAMVAAQQPAEFLAGDRSSGTALPHARLRITETGQIAIVADSLFRGYFPDARAPGELVTQDLGELDAQGRLHVLGRVDAVIITGGKKVHAGEVEAILRDSGEFADVAVIGMPDSEWGQAVVARRQSAQFRTSDGAASRASATETIRADRRLAQECTGQDRSDGVVGAGGADGIGRFGGRGVCCALP